MGGDYVLRAMGHSDGTCNPQIKITRADGTTEITHLNGTTTSTRTAPNVYIFTWESPAAESEQVQLINTASSGTCYWHQVEVLPNLIDNPSMERVTGTPDPWIPDGWYDASTASPGEISRESVNIHSGLYSAKFSANTTYKGLDTNNFTGTNTKFYSGGLWYNRVSGTLYAAYGYANWKRQTDASGVFTFPVTSTGWKHTSGVMRSDYTNSNPIVFTTLLAEAHEAYSDDFYNFQLSDVSLTVTPAIEANSLETSGLRVDGADTLTQTIDSLTTTSGNIQFKFTPRHSWSTATSFGNTSPVIATFYNSANDYLKLYYQSATILRLTGVFNGTTVTADTSGAPTLNAGTTYAIKITYAQNGNLVLYIDGVSSATASMSTNVFGTAPTTAYFGSDNTGANQYDLTVSAPAFLGSVTATENTTAPYYKFGSKSVKLVASADGQYVTSINPASTATHTLSAYVYDGTTGNVGGTVSATIAKLVFNGNVVTPAAYTDMGGGWWRLTYSAATASAAGDYGVAVLSGKTIYVDGVQLEEKAYATTYADGAMGTGYAWDAPASPHNSSSTRTAETLKYASTGNISATAGSISMWVLFDPGSAQRTLFDLSSDGSNLFMLRHHVSNLPQVYIGSYINGNGVSTKQWVNITVTYTNGGNLILYQNGVSVGTPIAYTTSPIASTLNIGNPSTGRVGSETQANDVMSDFRIFSSALTSTEVADLYYSGLGSHSEQTVASERYTDGEPPVLVWHFDEGYSTVAHDSTTYLNSGTISGATWSDDTYGASSSNKALSFDGTNDYVSRSYTADTELNPGTAAFSVSTWFKHSSTVPVAQQTLISRYSGAGYKVYMNTGGYMCFGLDGDSTWSPTDVTCTTTSYADSNWHHMEAIKGASTIAIFIDGVQKSSTAFTVSTSLSGSSPTLYVGVDSDGTSNPWTGFIDEVRVYNSSRSTTQVEQEFVARGSNKGVSAQMGGTGAAGQLGTGLVGYWKMDESSGTLTDSSGNANTGTWGGTGSSHYTTGKYGNGSGFNGTDDYVESSTIPSITTAITLSAWVKPNFTDGTGLQAYAKIISQPVDSSNNDPWDNYALGFDGSSPAKFHAEISTGTSGSGINVYSTSTIISGNWYFVSAVYNGQTLKIYVNGKEEGVTNTTLTIGVSNRKIYFGNLDSGNHSSNWYKGNIDEARIYNRALSPAEVRALYDYAPGPVAHWSFDEGSGLSAADKSGNGNTGTLASAPATPAWSAGKYGKGLNFDGVDDYVEKSNPGADVSGPITTEAWVKLVPGNDIQTIISRGDRGGGTGYYLGIRSSGVIYLYLNGVKQSYVSSSITFTDGVWHHIAATWNNPTFTYYVDGKVAGTDSASGTITYPDTPYLRLGYRTDSFYPLKGYLDDVRIYNYARTQKQIVQDMNAGHPAVGSPVGSAVAYYKFDEGQGTVAHNSGNSGSALNGTLTNMSSPATATSGWTNSGKFGKGLVFDESDDYVDCGTSGIPTTLPITLSAWVYFNNDQAAGNYDYVIQSSILSGSNDILAIAREALTNKAYYIEDGTIRTGDIVPTGRWVHLVMVYRDNTPYVEFYMDGVKRTITQPSSVLSSSGAICKIGAFYGNGGYYNHIAGSIDEVKIYNYALSEDEVKMEYNRGSALVMGSLGTESAAGVAASNSASRAYCPPGNTEGNCAAGLSPAPVAEWNFDEGSGQSTLDTSGNANTGQLGSTSGVDATDPAWTNGKVGKGLRFDGVDDYVSMGDQTTLNFGTNFSVSAWIYPVSNPTGDGSGIINKIQSYFSGRNGYALVIRGMGEGKCAGMVADASGYTENAGTGSAIALNTWSHVELTYDGSNLRCFLNGIIQWTTPATRTPTPSGYNFLVGDNLDNSGTRYFPGRIDNVKTYNYARTPAQIAWDYNRGAPVAWYKLDECSASTLHSTNSAYDSSLNGTLTVGAGGTQTSAGSCSSGVSTEAWNNGTTGKFSNSLNFDGTDDYITVAASSKLQSAGVWTLSAWVKTPAPSVGWKDIITNQWHYPLSGVLVAIGGTGTGTTPGSIHVALGNGSTFASHDGVKSVADGNWHLVTVSFASGDLRMYIDGILDKQVTSSITSISYVVNSLQIGKNCDDTIEYWNGQLDDVRIYNYALTAQQVKDAYNGAAVSFK